MTDTPAAQAKPSNWNLPNILTVGRIVCVPIFLWLLLVHDGEHVGWRFAALAMFAVAIATDRIDGEIARRRNLITDFGKIADPIADKALVGGALIGLNLIGLLPVWVTVVILGRELAVTVIRFIVIRRVVMPAGRGGKLKTVLQAMALALFIAPLELLFGGLATAPGWAVLVLAIVVTVVTGFDYAIKAARLWRGTEPGSG